MALTRLPALAPLLAAAGCGFSVHDISTTPGDPMRNSASVQEVDRAGLPSAALSPEVDPDERRAAAPFARRETPLATRPRGQGADPRPECLRNSRQHRWSVLGPLVAMESAALLTMLAAGGMSRLFGGVIIVPIILVQSILGIASSWNRDLLSGESPSILDNIGSTAAKLAAGWVTGIVLFHALPHPTLTIGVGSLLLAAPNMGGLLKDPESDVRKLPLYRYALWSLVGSLQLAMLFHHWSSLGTIWNSRFGIAKSLALIPISAVTGLDLAVKGAQGYHSGLDWMERSASSLTCDQDP